MACGTGKTLVAAWAHERLASSSTVVLVPSLSLLGQTLREWAAEASRPFSYLAVCSDDTVSDEMVPHPAALGLPATTRVDDIAPFLGGESDRPRVIFATYQSSDRIALAVQRVGHRFDLVVADEAHRTTGRRGTTFSAVLDDERIRARRRLFMTATPRFYTQRVRESAGEEGAEVASMGEKKVYGPSTGYRRSSGSP